MRYREVAIEDDKSIGDSGTETIPINLRDPITALIVRFKATNDGSLENQPPERQISKVEIVDGGTTYWSLNGQMAVAAAVYGLGRWPHQWYDERDGSNQRINFPLLFGRYLGDPEFAFDPTRLNNPALRITWADQDGYVNDSLTLGVTARVMEGLPPPAQCLMWKEVEAWTSAGEGVHTVDLPTDYPYRALLMRAWIAEGIPSSIWTRYKLDCDVGKFIAFDLATHEFRDIIKQYDGPFHHRQFCMGVSATYKHAWMGETLSVFGSPAAGPYIVDSYTAFWPYFALNVRLYDGTPAPTLHAQVLVTGLFPHSSYKYPFGRPMEPLTWFDPTEFKDIRLQISEGLASANAAVAVQQPRSLP